jgi:hypothetical protein
MGTLISLVHNIFQMTDIFVWVAKHSGHVPMPVNVSRHRHDVMSVVDREGGDDESGQRVGPSERELADAEQGRNAQ